MVMGKIKTPRRQKVKTSKLKAETPNAETLWCHCSVSSGKRVGRSPTDSLLTEQWHIGRYAFQGGLSGV
jgi:hypothetical protein